MSKQADRSQASGPARGLSRFRASLPALIEIGVWALVSAGFIALMSRGTSNGFGVFHQPRSGLVAPLLVGGVINAATFWLHAFVALPRAFRVRGVRRYLAWAAGLGLANIAAQTVSQRLIILTLEPHLAGVGWDELIRENAYGAVTVLALSALYRFARDWLTNLDIQQRLGQRLEAVETELDRIRAEGASEETFLRFDAGRGQIQIPAAEVQWLKAAGNYVEIVTPRRTHLIYGSLSATAAALPPELFVRVHRSYVVGLRHITRATRRSVEVGDQSLPLGEAYRPAFLEAWEAPKPPPADAA